MITSFTGDYKNMITDTIKRLSDVVGLLKDKNVVSVTYDGKSLIVGVLYLQDTEVPSTFEGYNVEKKVRRKIREC